MTARNRGGSVPCALGRYYTDDDVALAVVRDLDDRGIVDFARAEHVLEPSAGGGAFVRALRALRDERGYAFRVLAIDIDPRAAAAEWADDFRVFDALDVDAWPEEWPDRVDVVIGNPPYSIRVPKLGKDGEPLRYPEHRRRKGGVEPHPKAGQIREAVIEVGTDHALRCLEVARIAVLLFREGFAGGGARYARLWSRGVLLNQDTLVPRPSFTGGSTDSCEYATFALDARGGIPWHRRTRGWVVWSASKADPEAEEDPDGRT